MGLIKDRIELANNGENSKAIIKLKSGWVVIGDDQRIPGYCLLLRDPVVKSLNSVSEGERRQFLEDMASVGDALREVFGIETVNYSILGNSDKELHAHIHPRFDDESIEYLRMPPWFYHFRGHKIRDVSDLEIEEMKMKIEKELQKFA